ncbi:MULTISPECIES: bacterioferritin-associated ferredoxin [Lonsdalea]|uniref:Bacterioferritin-associated ferredoxin n=1 Tax=Lonsdalea populi TaxID=1172565 RepID=A0A3N0U528_9GAMM|nr:MULTISPECIES: bacterioferritin-associated ferredoxin [Lonsdalea]QPQ24508.1 bacterioferritin-associated ferredoxin [Lonsdalea populi]ROH75736.1 bacterioferritin-associated ferredoxin [Lonsdalea populi]ROH76228.1 bacterioferritin-associated ferredoxin [Lonsdalea populi]ROH76693.1 bacterioferritin-associated ferredoxin [Lonsdalea populi]
MYVCLCNAITDKAIRRVVHQHQPQSLQHLKQLIPIGTECGKCLRHTRAILQEEKERLPELYKVA